MTNPISHRRRKSGLASIAQRLAGRAAGGFMPAESPAESAKPEPRDPRNLGAMLIAWAEDASDIKRWPERPGRQAAVVGLYRSSIAYRAAERSAPGFRSRRRARPECRRNFDRTISREQRVRWIWACRGRRRSLPAARAASVEPLRC